MKHWENSKWSICIVINCLIAGNFWGAIFASFAANTLFVKIKLWMFYALSINVIDGDTNNHWIIKILLRFASSLESSHKQIKCKNPIFKFFENFSWLKNYWLGWVAAVSAKIFKGCNFCDFHSQPIIYEIFILKLFHPPDYVWYLLGRMTSFDHTSCMQLLRWSRKWSLPLI